MIRYLDTAKKLQNNKYGIAKEKYKYDQFGNEILREFRDEQGRLAAKNGIARVVSKYNQDGHRILEEFYDAKGELKEDKSGIAKRKWDYKKYEEEGLLSILFSTYNKSGYIVNNFETVKKYDNNGLQAEEWYFKNSDPLHDSAYVHKYQWEYDQKGNITEERYIGFDWRDRKESIRSVDGYSKYQWFYNNSGQRILEKSFFGKQVMRIFKYPMVTAKSQKDKINPIYFKLKPQKELANKTQKRKRNSSIQEYSYDSNGNLYKIV
ncbi:MAG: hypothetical protein AAF518_27715, partial [Spirochaetota bacterium]